MRLRSRAIKVQKLYHNVDPQCAKITAHVCSNLLDEWIPNGKLPLKHLGLNCSARRTAGSGDDQYVPDHPEPVHGDSSSCERPYKVIRLDQKLHHEINPVTHRNRCYALGWTKRRRGHMRKAYGSGIFTHIRMVMKKPGTRP
jgi:hypothetical protein